MFDIGFWELVLIAVVALVVFGPEKLPQAIRTATQYVRAFKRMVNNVKDELSEELNVQDLKDEIHKVEQLGREAIKPLSSSSSVADTTDTPETDSDVSDSSSIDHHEHQSNDTRH